MRESKSEGGAHVFYVSDRFLYEIITKVVEKYGDPAKGSIEDLNLNEMKGLRSIDDV